MNVFLWGAALTALFIAVVSVSFAVGLDSDDARAAPGWWILPMLVLSVLLMVGVLV